MKQNNRMGSLNTSKMKKRLFRNYLIGLFLIIGLVFNTACDEEDPVTLEERQEREDRIITEFLDANNITNAQRTSTGLYHIPITEGTGVSPVLADSVTVEYVGRFLDGKRFDSTLFSDDPFSFIIGTNQVIEGWEEALLLMKVGGTSRFIIPSSLAYGSGGERNRSTGEVLIPPNTILDFEIELISFENSSLSNGN